VGGIAQVACKLGWYPSQRHPLVLEHGELPHGKLLLLDDLDRQLGRKELSPEQTMQLLDLCPRVLLTTTRPPRRLRMPPPLLDRLQQLASLELQDPGPSTRYLLLCHFARRHNISLPERHARRLARQWALPAGMLETQLLNLAQGFVPQPQALSPAPSPLSGNARQQVLQVARTTAKFYRLALHQLRGSSRQRRVVHARRMAMFLSRRHLSATLDQIGQVLGGKDHTTVLYHCRQFQQQLRRDAQARYELRQLERLLGFQKTQDLAAG